MPAADHGAQLLYRQHGDDPRTRLQNPRIVEAPDVETMIPI